jgi:hypothetical protein
MWDMYLGEASLMTWRILLFLVLGVATFGATPSGDDGFVPAESKVVSLGSLAAAPGGVDSRCVARLAPSGRPIVLYQGRLVTLVEGTGDPLVGWTPPNDAEAILDFCWLDGQTLVLLREMCLDFIRGGKLVRGVILAGKGMRVARADAGHCYVFGGEGWLLKHDVLLYGMNGSVRNLLRAPLPVTAVTGDGSNTFVAVGSVVFLLTPGQKAKAVFHERVCIKDLAVAPPGGIFYLTEDGVGYMESPESGMVFLRRKVTSLDSRSGELVLVTKDREILLIKPVSGFSRAVREVLKFVEGKR